MPQKSFNEFFDEILEEYAQARMKMIPGVDISYSLRQKRRELATRMKARIFSTLDRVEADLTGMEKRFEEDA